MLKCSNCNSYPISQCNSCDGKLFCNPCSHKHFDYHFSQKTQCNFGCINIKLSDDKKNLLKSKIDESIKNIKTQKKNIKSEAISIIKHIEIVVRDSIIALDILLKKYTIFYKLTSLEEQDITLYEEILKDPYCVKPSVLSEFQEALSQKVVPNYISNLKKAYKKHSDMEYLIKFTRKNSLAKNLVIASNKEFLISSVLYNTCIVSSLYNNQYEDAVILQSGEIKDLTLSKDNKYVVLGFEYGYLIVWDLFKRFYEVTFKGHDSDVNSVTISIDSQYVVTGSKDQTVKVWDIIEKEEKAKFLGHTGQVVAVDITYDKRFAVSSSSDNTVRLWNIIEKSQEAVFYNQPAVIDSAVITYFNDFLYMNSGNWKILYRKPQLFKEKNDLVLCFALSEDKKILASGYTDCTMRIWHLKNLQKEVIIYKNTKMNCIGITNNNNFIVSGWDDNKIRVWDFLQNKEHKVLQENFGIPLQLSLINLHDIAAFSSETLIFWDLPQNNPVFKAYKSYIHAYSKCGRLCILHKSDDLKALEVWDFIDKKQLFFIDGLNSIPIYVFITEDNKLAILVTDENTIFIWDLVYKYKLDEYNRCASYPLCIVASSDSKILAFGSNGSIVRIVYLSVRGKEIAFQGHEKFVNSILITKDNRFVLSGSSDKTIRMWSLEGQICEMIFEGHNEGVNCIALSKDNRSFISGSDDKTIRIWNLISKECVAIIQGFMSKITCVKISSDNSFLAFQIGKNAIAIWNLIEYKQDIELYSFTKNSDFEITADNKFLVSQDQSDNLRVWNLPEKRLEILISKPCNCYFKGFTCKNMNTVYITTGFGVLELNIVGKAMKMLLFFDNGIEKVFNDNPQLYKTLLPKFLYAYS